MHSLSVLRGKKADKNECFLSLSHSASFLHPFALNNILRSKVSFLKRKSLDNQQHCSTWKQRFFSGEKREGSAAENRDRYSYVSFVNFYHKFSQSVSVNQTTCPIPSVEIPWNSPGLLCYISAVGQGLYLSSVFLLFVCVCVCVHARAWCFISHAAEVLWSKIAGQCNCTFVHLK